MATYKTIELIDKLSELINDGYEYVDINELDADEEFPESLTFEAIESNSSSIDYEDVESVIVPEDYDYQRGYHKVKGTDSCLTLSFTYNEISYLSHAIDNVLQFTKEYIKDPSCSKEEIADIKASSIHWRNLQAKFAKFFKNLRINYK